MLDKSEPNLGSPARKISAHHDFRPDINGLRALAVLSVLAFHAGYPFAPGGFAGVDIFFVISGFLISRIILSERVAGGFSLAMFYAKRAKRILPALLLMLLTTWTIGWFDFQPSSFRTFGGHMEASTYFSVNLWLYRQATKAGYFALNARFIPLLHLWSLSIEEQFYLIWPALLLILLKARRLLAPAIGAILLASAAFCLFKTNTDPTAAFYSLSTRAWELALGALLAQREVFAKSPLASPRAAEAGASLGILMMLGGIALIHEGDPWPGWRALIPTLGCALVIASPGSKIGRIVLGNRLAQFFGLISYPLYLWHWPLLSAAHLRLGDELSPALTAAILALSVLLAAFTWKFVEGKAAAAFSKTPWRVALSLIAGLILCGALGLATRMSNGFPQRFSPSVLAVFDYRDASTRDYAAKIRCATGGDEATGTLEEERLSVRRYFDENSCLKLNHPDRPTIVLVGDSHILHLLPTLDAAYADRANIVILAGGGCGPLIAETRWSSGLAGTTRCKAINEYTVAAILTLKPAAVVVGSYFAQFYHERIRLYPGFLDDFDANIAALRQAGFHAPIFVLGQAPTWSPAVPYLIGKEMSAGQNPREFTRDGLNPDSLAIDARFAAHPWGENTFYISQAKALCNDEGCRRLVGPQLPQDMIAFDYGHYTAKGASFAVQNILGPVLDRVLDAPAGK